MGENKYTQNKSSFIVAFLAALLAFSTFKEELKSVSIPLGFYNSNGLEVFTVLVTLFTLTAYFYALDYIRYGTKFQNSLILKLLLPVANFFYAFTLLFPLMILFIWMVNLFISWIKLPELSSTEMRILVSVISSLLPVYVSMIVSAILTKNTYSEISKNFEKMSERQFRNANLHYRHRYYSASILELFKVFELNIRKQLEEKGISTRNLNTTMLLAEATKEKLIPREKNSSLNNLLNIRDQAASGKMDFKKKDADIAFKLISSLNSQRFKAPSLNRYI